MPISLLVTNDVALVEWVGAASDAELSAYFDALEPALAGIERYAMIYDLRRASPPTSSQRRQLAQLTARDGPGLRTRCVGIAFVIDSALVRAALTGLLWIQPIATEHAVLALMQDARAWARVRLNASATRDDASGRG